MTWPTKKLGEVCEFEGGKQPPKKYFIEQPKEGYVRLLQIRDFESDEKAVYIPKTLAQNYVKEDDILISRYGGFGNYKSFFNILTGKAGAFNVALIKVIPDVKVVNKKFIYYQLQLPKYKIALIKKSDRAVQSGFRKEDLEKLEIVVPPIPIQQKIVERLDAIKKAQELNDKQIELAEELFQSLLHRELDPKGKNWGAKKLGEICDCKDGDWILTKDLQTGNDVRLIQLGDIGEINFLDKTRKYISKKRCQELSCTLLKPNDILLNRMGDPIGIACILPHLSYPAITAVDVTIIRSKKEIANQFFILYSLNSKAIRRQIEAFATGSTRRRISRKNLEKIKIPLPPFETQQKIVEKLSAVQEYKKKLLDQKQKLQELFESVLNKSFKGNL